MKIKQDAEYTAKLLLVNLDRYSDEKDKDFSRFRFSKANMRVICGRAKLFPSFVEELAAELLMLGWQMFDASDSEFAFIRADKLSTWPKLGPQRITDKHGFSVFKSTAEIQVAFEAIPGQLLAQDLPD